MVFLCFTKILLERRTQMFRIVQPLNNNVAVVKNESGEQAVVMGLGIIFKKKKGDLLAEERVEKVFQLKSEESRENFSALLKDVPLDFITTSYEIIDYGIQQFQFPVQEYIYVTLTDHIYCSYQALQRNTYKSNHLPDMSEQYPTEYKIAEHALVILKEKLDVDFPKDEIGRLALQFINAKGEDVVISKDEQTLTRQMIALVQEELLKHGIKRTKKNSNFYDRLMIHLTYFIERLDQDDSDSKVSMKNLEEHIKKDYPEAYQIGEDIYEVIRQHLGGGLHPNEKVYLVIHIQRLL